MPVIIGTSGWQYRHWRGLFYPQELAAAHWLPYYAERFAAVEVNNTFYHLPEKSTFAGWAERTPAGFRVAAKMSRYLTHLKRLHEPQEPAARFLERAAGLGDKLAVVLLQLPPRMRADPGALDETLSALQAGPPVAVEFRDDSWDTEEVHGVLERHQAAWCLADSQRRGVAFRRTAGWTYIRFHDGEGSPEGCYQPHQLKAWAGRLAETWGPRATIYAFFNNDGNGCAPRDAGVFADACRDAGLDPTRTPEAGAPLV
ncbi:MAG TPA: DUF72 domain-containing protein [Actinomycetota bacterium]|nr:DUF72 domain-containing protein [Actinomycetota bacterium]